MPDHVVICDGLTKRFRKTVAVKGLDLSVPKGSVFGLLGRNGAGKTTTINMIIGLLSPSSGAVRVLGRNPAKDPSVRQRVGYVPEQTRIHKWMRVADVLRFASRFYPNWDWPRTDRLIERLQLPRGKRVNQLSHGMEAKLSLVLALAFNPELLALDEPFSGLDAVARRDFLKNLEQITAEERCTVLVSSHLIGEVEKIVNWVAIIEEGALLTCQPLERLRASMKRVLLVCKDGAADALERLQGVVKVEGEGQEKLVTLANPDASALQELSDACAQIKDISEMSLEDLFIEWIERAPKAMEES